MDLFLFAVVATAIIGAVLFIYTALSFGSFRLAVKHYQNTDAAEHWLVVALILWFALLLLDNIGPANGSEIEWGEYTDIYIGLDHQGESPACVEQGPDDGLTVSTGLRQHILGTEIGNADVDLQLNLNHISCVTNEDDETSNSIGLMLNFRFDWRNP